MTIDEQRKLVDGLRLRAERMFDSLIANGNNIKDFIDSPDMQKLSKEIAKLNQMEEDMNSQIKKQEEKETSLHNEYCHVIKQIISVKE